MRAHVILFVAFAVGCGGAASPSQTPASDSTPSSNVAAPEATQGGGGGAAQQSRTPEVSGARSELDRAEAQLQSAPGDCVAACRALASMERAAAHLCELDSGTECGRARERVEAARARVRSSCGGCGS